MKKLRKEILNFQKRNHGQKPDYILIHVWTWDNIRLEMFKIGYNMDFGWEEFKFEGINLVRSYDIQEGDIILIKKEQI